MAVGLGLAFAEAVVGHHHLHLDGYNGIFKDGQYLTLTHLLSFNELPQLLPTSYNSLQNSSVVVECSAGLGLDGGLGLFLFCGTGGTVQLPPRPHLHTLVDTDLRGGLATFLALLDFGGCILEAQKAVPALGLDLRQRHNNTMKEDKGKQEIKCISYNPDRSHLAIGTSRGFKIYTINPFTMKQHRDFATSIGFLEMVDRSNLVALVASNQPQNQRLRIWDDRDEEYVAETIFKAPIKALRIRQKKVVVVLINKVFVLDFSTLETIHVFETAPNQDGLISLNNDINNFVMALPGPNAGGVVLCFFEKKKQLAIKAHQSAISLLQVSFEGHKLATASEKGIQIRIYNTRNGNMIQQLRRGNQFATVYSVTFDLKGMWLAVSSDSCNVHIFALKLAEEEKQEKDEFRNYEEKQNPKSMFNFMKNIIPYFDSEYSFAYYKIPNYETDMVSKVSFPQEDNTIVITTNFGNFYVVRFNPTKGGETKQMVEYSV